MNRTQRRAAAKRECSTFPNDSVMTRRLLTIARQYADENGRFVITDDMEHIMHPSLWDGRNGTVYTLTGRGLSA